MKFYAPEYAKSAVTFKGILHMVSNKVYHLFMHHLALSILTMRVVLFITPIHGKCKRFVRFVSLEMSIFLEFYEIEVIKMIVKLLFGEEKFLITTTVE